MKEQNEKHFRQCGAWHIFMFSLNETYDDSKKLFIWSIKMLNINDEFPIVLSSPIPYPQPLFLSPFSCCLVCFPFPFVFHCKPHLCVPASVLFCKPQHPCYCPHCRREGWVSGHELAWGDNSVVLTMLCKFSVPQFPLLKWQQYGMSEEVNSYSVRPILSLSLPSLKG